MKLSNLSLYVVRLLVALLAAVVTYTVGFLSGHELGAEQQLTAAMTRENAVSEQHARSFRALDARYRASESDLRQSAAAVSNALQKALYDEKTQHDRLVAGLRSGAVRLSVPVLATNPACGASDPGSASPAAGDREEARAELAPTAAADLAAIADDGNVAIHQLNACIDRYNDVRQRLNTLRLEPTLAQAQ